MTSLIGSTALATGREAIGAMVAARTETENNYLAPSEVKQMIGELVQCRVEPDGAACRTQVKEKFEQLSMAKGGGKLYGCKGEGEAACHAQRLQNQAGSKELEMMQGLGSSGPEYVVMDGRVIMNGYGWSPGEYTVIDSLLNLNWNDERISHNAWLESFYQEAGAPIAIGAGMAVTALRAEASAVKAEAQLARDVAKTESLRVKEGAKGSTAEINSAERIGEEIGRLRDAATIMV